MCNMQHFQEANLSLKRSDDQYKEITDKGRLLSGVENDVRVAFFRSYSCNNSSPQEPLDDAIAH